MYVYNVGIMINLPLKNFGIPYNPHLLLTMASQKDYALNSLKEIANWNGKAQDIPRVVAAAFGADDYVECIRNLQEKGIDSGSYINSLDKVRCALSLARQHARLPNAWVQRTDSLPDDSDLQNRCLLGLRSAGIMRSSLIPT